MSIQTDDDPMPGEWVDCWQCGGEGLGDGCTCMDDTCCCAEPEPPTCHICGGAGGWTARATIEDSKEAVAWPPKEPER